MPIFAPKGKPLLRWGRLVHLLLAATATACGAHLWSDTGAACVGFGSIVLGFAWELGNRFLHVPKWEHAFADGLDFWAFVLGAAISGIGWVLYSA